MNAEKKILKNVAVGTAAIVLLSGCMGQEEKDAFGNVQSAVDSTKMLVEQLAARIETLEKGISNLPRQGAANPASAVQPATKAPGLEDDPRLGLAVSKLVADLKGKLGDVKAVDAVTSFVPVMLSATDSKGGVTQVVVHMKRGKSEDWIPVFSLDHLVAQLKGSERSLDAASLAPLAASSGPAGTTIDKKPNADETKQSPKSVPNVSKVSDANGADDVKRVELPTRSSTAKVGEGKGGVEVKRADDERDDAAKVTDPVAAANAKKGEGLGTAMINGRFEVQADGSKVFVPGDPSVPTAGDNAKTELMSSQVVERDGVKVMEKVEGKKTSVDLEAMTRGKWVELPDGSKKFVPDATPE